MTTAQESTNGRRDFPPPCSFPESQQQNPSKDSTNDNSNSLSATPQPEAFPASAYHVPPELYAPKADSFHDTIPDGLSAMKMPDRCQFMFSDGRQCKMARSDIHPSLCTYHSEREEQLFGTPHTRGGVRGPSFDLPELFSASRDLTTAFGVNRALAQVFRLLAQRRISRQEAATFAKLAQLLLQSIRAARAESVEACIESLSRGPEQPMREGVILSESALADERSAHFAYRSGLREIPPELSPVNNSQRERNAQTVSAAANSPAMRPAPAAPPASSPARTVVNNRSEMNTSTTVACNSPEISTYENVQLNPLQNEHLHKNGSQSLCSSGRPDAFGREI